MAARILLVGVASDGPTNLITRAASEKEILGLYGGWFTQRDFIVGSATGLTLLYEPLGALANEVNGKKDWLYYPQVQGQSLSFGAPGGSGLQMLDTVYQPYLGQGDLLFAARSALRQGAGVPYLARIGGTRATLVSGDWVFEARFAGARYNRVYITSTASSLTIWGLEPNFPSLSFVGESADDIPELVRRQYEAGLSPVLVTKSGSGLPTLSRPLTGGVDGSIDATTLAKFLDEIDIPADVSHIVVLAPLASGMVTEVVNFLNGNRSQPRMFFFGAPTYSAPASTWVLGLSSSLPTRLDMIAMFCGTADVLMAGKTRARYAHEPAAIAFMKEEGFNLTNLPIEAEAFSPRLTETELDDLKARGVVSLMRYIGNDISVYQGVTSANQKSFLFSSKIAEVLAIAHTFCLGFVGRVLPEGPHVQIANQLRLALSEVSFLRVQKVEVEVVLDEMYVQIEGLLPEEILRVSFSIRNR